jgi:large subunit ribosomal protein L6
MKLKNVVSVADYWYTFIKVIKMALAVVLREEIPVPEGVEVTIDKEVTVKGPKGELKRKFKQGNVTIKQEDSMVVLETRFPKKKDKAMLGTIKSHISNMIQGLTEGFTYRMKIVYAHFPMTVKAAKEKVTIENFLGERYPRTAKIVGSAQVKIQGDEVTVTGVNKEDVGQTMANLEQATKIKGRDPRVFQDGIYLVAKE